MSCDFRLAAESATFALPEMPNLAALPGSGGISRLTRLIGPHWARWISLACRTVDARKALLMGLVHEVYPDAEFASDVQTFARDLTKLPREAMGLAKLAIDIAADSDRIVACNFDRVANTLLSSSDEHLQLLDAFNKRSAERKRK